VLTITPSAADAIRQLVEHSDVPESGGVRIAAGEPTEQGTPLQLALVEGPEPGDEVIGADAAAVFLEPLVAEVLEDTILDAHISDGEVEFALRDNAPLPPISTNGKGPA
jgi:Fe-S cluster assembly iron-binding protein IscA